MAIASSLFSLSMYFLRPRETLQIITSVWVLSSVIEVPICMARVADKLGIEHDFPAVKDHIIQSLEPGMTPEEVEKTLSQIAPVEIGQTFVDEEQETNTEILISLCDDNPLGNIILLVYYSKDGHLINVVDAYED